MSHESHDALMGQYDTVNDIQIVPGRKNGTSAVKMAEKSENIGIVASLDLEENHFSCFKQEEWEEEEEKKEEKREKETGTKEWEEKKREEEKKKKKEEKKKEKKEE
ncbi:hypothetical protein M8J77_001562 [Diaphorina citri]|nr:hypothetical protein M8J77_001562 [Diaphorina citri]